MSGAFNVHKHPRIISYLATHSIPIELGITDEFEQTQKQSWTISGSPIRLLLDNDVTVTVCGFRRTKSVSEEMYDVIKQCNLDAAETLDLIFNGFRSNFQRHQIRQQMIEYARAESVKLLKDAGFVHFGRRKWIVKEGAYSRRKSLIAL